MKLPNFIYRSERIGKNGKPFSLYKIRTLKPTTKQFADKEIYTKHGQLLRKLKIDEMPQLFNVIKRDLNIVGPRPDFQSAYDVMPDWAKNKILSVRPGLTSLSSVYFYDEEQLLEKLGEDKFKNYYGIIKPAKILLDSFYVENKCWILDLAILYMTLKKIIRATFTKTK